MIPQDNLDRQDFSIYLPMTIYKLRAISVFLSCVPHGELDLFGDEPLKGAAYQLADIIEDLEAMNHGLYGDGAEAGKEA